MKKSVVVSALWACLVLPLYAHAFTRAKPVPVDAYYVGVTAETDPKFLQPEQIDYDAVSIITYFGIMVNADSSLDFNHSQQACPPVATKTVALAHAAGKKVLISVGAAAEPDFSKNTRFEDAVSDPIRAKFITDLIGVVTSCDFDGIDVDWEPVVDADAPAYTTFTHELRAALDDLSFRSRYRMLTTAVAWEPQLFASLQDYFDQIDLMTYDLADEGEGSPLA